MLDQSNLFHRPSYYPINSSCWLIKHHTVLFFICLLEMDLSETEDKNICSKIFLWGVISRYLGLEGKSKLYGWGNGTSYWEYIHLRLLYRPGNPPASPPPPPPPPPLLANSNIITITSAFGIFFSVTITPFNIYQFYLSHCIQLIHTPEFSTDFFFLIDLWK